MNVFIDRDWNVWLGDFGFVWCVYECEFLWRFSNLFFILEVDIEEGVVWFLVGLEDENFLYISIKIDVFNFGMLLFEIMSGWSVVFLDVDFIFFSFFDWVFLFIKNDNVMVICDMRLKFF